MISGNIACIGAGLIGAGWATLFASRGFHLTLQDYNEDILEKSIENLYASLIFLEENNLIKPGVADAALQRIEVTTDIEEAVSDAGYIQESVYDDLNLKQQIFREIDAAAPDHAIIASSASGLLMTDIQKAAAHPERCVMVHPILPVHLIPVVEIVGGEHTSSDTVQTASKFMQKLGKTPVILKKEVPGYIVNRLQAALLREAMDLVDKGVASAEDVDTAFCRGIGLRDAFIGPLLRAHLAGNSIENFFKRFDQSYQSRWKTMETWTSFPPSATSAVIEGVNAMRQVRGKSMDELKKWRDAKIVRQLDMLELR